MTGSMENLTKEQAWKLIQQQNMGSYVKENPDMADFYKLMLEEFTVDGVSIWRVKNEM